ncbi:MAG TPA: serine hydrolase domain-containing protein [Vicinamibacterales bacterium]|nr:serine hydrolase domain-containing protein [Vicinamibacterales bacterium]
MLKHASSTILVLSLVSVQAPAQERAVPAYSSRQAKIDAIFADYDKNTSPGCAVAVYEGDRIAYRKAYGMANLDHDVRLTPSTVFHVASVSKQFTGTAILLLAQDGKLALDDDIRKYLPELPDFGTTITIRQLANHTSGIRDQWDLLGLAGWRYSRDLITDDDVLELLSRQKALNFTPGERHLYSNSGFTLLAVIVSRVSGKSFREFTTERIFKPLGMSHTHFRDTFSEIVKNQAYGYAPDRGSFRLSVTNFDTAGATSLLTTVEDMAKWHANFDARTVGGEQLQAKLLERGVLSTGTPIDYAFGITHGKYRSLAVVGHGGSDAGYRADFVRFPDRRLGIATLCNISTANPGLLSRRVADLFLPSDLPSATTEPPEDNTPEVPVPEATLKRYAGIYWYQPDGIARPVIFDAGKLHAVSGRERIALRPVGGGAFVMTGGPRARLTIQEEAGEVQLKPAGSTQVFVRMDPFAPTADQIAEYAGAYRSDEVDAVFRMSVKDGALTLERSKLRPNPLEPLIKDAFRSQPGIVQFTRDGQGRVTGFLLQGNRVKHVKFWKEPTPPRTTSTPSR